MRRIPLRTTLALLSILTSVTASGLGQEADPLWSKAVAVAEANRDWLPGKIYTRVEQLDGKGNPTKTEESWLRLSPGQDGLIETELIKALADGKDVTEERRIEMAKQKDGAPGNGVSIGLGDCNPFAPERQSSVSFTRAGRTGNPPGVAYRFSMSGKDLSYKGTAWLDEQDGTPVGLQYTQQPLPKYVANMLCTVRFRHVPGGPWYADDMTIEGAGGFLLFKMSMRTTIQFSDYWQATAKTEAG